MSNKTGMNKYTFINPKIAGSLDSSIQSHSHVDAANGLWLKLSEHLTNNVPSFPFTIQNTNDGKLYSFEVTESSNGKNAEYSLNEIPLKLSGAGENKFKSYVQNLDNIIQKGGRENRKHRRLDEDDSSSSSSSDEIINKYKLLRSLDYQQSPIVYWWYNPLVYNVPRVYVPTFKAPLIPYIEIQTSSTFMG